MTQLEPLVFSSPAIAVAVLLIVALGSIVQAGLGMGFGLTAAPVLALLDPALVPAAALYLGMATAIIGAASERGTIVWREVGIGMVGRTTGILAGLAVLVFLVSDVSVFQLVFGSVIGIALLFSILGWNLALNAKNLVSMGVVSGFMGVITSVGAPPLALIYQSRKPELARPTLATFFAFGGFMSLTGLYATGLAGWDDVWMALFMAPAAIIGTVLGRRMRGRFSARYRPLLLGVAGVAAVLLIAKGSLGTWLA
ncbi:MAG: sulfite exporter TauE/SafE family protein [Pseudomonadota bacterium]